tara:strand:- start:628 stop:1335 length:708 start_codon:yes stop_codon:yes gene_type:complete
MGMHRGAKIVSDNVIFCVDAASRRSYDTGTDFRDLSGFDAIDQLGDMENGPAYSEESGGCIILDGTNDRIKFPADSVQPDFPFSLNSWVLFNEEDQLDPIWRSAYGSTYYGGFWVTKTTDNVIQMNTGTWGSASDSNRRFKTGATTIAVDTWYNICAVFTNLTTSTLYINGVDDGGTDGGTGNEIDYNSSKVAYIGRFPSSTYANIKIAHIAAYSKALSEAEIKQNYNAIRGRFT